MPKVITLTLPKEEENSRLDHFLKRQYPNVPYGLLAKLARKGTLKIEGKKVQLNHRLQPGATLTLPSSLTDSSSAPAPKSPVPISEKERLFFKEQILIETESFLAFNKPAGLATQGGSKQKTSLDSLAKAYYQEESITPHLVHRLDKETSGVILMAKTLSMAKALTEAFKEKTIQKTYVARVKGSLKKKTGVISAPLLIQQNKTRKVIVDPEGKPAETQYSVIKEKSDFSLLSLQPITGRMHQLRVHLAHMGHPILGDDKYGTARSDWEAYPTCQKRLYLHAEKIVLPKEIFDQPIYAQMPEAFSF